MIHKVTLNFPKIATIQLELDDELAPKTVSSFLSFLPLDVAINSWGEELYTNETPITAGLENAKPLVDILDVAYWPTGKAICFFWTNPNRQKRRDQTLFDCECYWEDY